MLHQIQLYDPDDFQEPEKRKVIAQKDGLANQGEINEWNVNILEEAEIPEGMKACIVPENHLWFIRTDGTLSSVSTPNIGAANKPQDESYKELLSFDKCGPLQIKLDEERRLAEFEKQERLKKHMASFEG